AGIGCGMMVYHVVRREFWHAGRTGLKFLGTAALLGCSVTLLTAHLGAMAMGRDVAGQHLTIGKELCLLLVTVVVAKLLFEASHFAQLRDREFTSLRRTALLMRGPLAPATALRFGLSAFGGVVLPLLLFTADAGTSAGLILTGSLLSFASLLGGEFA